MRKDRGRLGGVREGKETGQYQPVIYIKAIFLQKIHVDNRHVEIMGIREREQDVVYKLSNIL